MIFQARRVLLPFARGILFASLLQGGLGPSMPLQCPFKQTPPNAAAINSTEVEMAG